MESGRTTTNLYNRPKVVTLKYIKIKVQRQIFSYIHKISSIFSISTNFNDFTQNNFKNSLKNRKKLPIS
ncbi:hypothetical protein Cabys_1796 [Caldithrix abyssi DSM 13497]|uniref:Uncharacterized protein n=1 Tax=Caldithrix abyssi DSM 13497 TaxID=880073 RepID=A0A1J1C8E2_CALAY|nr:hypothetical protein Cabys_1796 [Caldithrix abyssi DSM 13497]